MMQSLKHNRVLIGLGSNLGDPAHNLKQAIGLLEELMTVELTVSPVYRSEPVGVKEQPWFLNQAVSFTDQLSMGPTAILGVLKRIESKLGRVPAVRFGPRLIDLDLLFYGVWVFGSENLVLPHPRFHERSFVLLPVMDLEPGLVDPRSGNTLREIWERNLNQFSQCLPVENGTNLST